MEEFKRFVDWAGGIPEAAKKLGISYQLAHKIYNGERPVTKRTAERVMQVSGRRFSVMRLLFGSEAA